MGKKLCNACGKPGTNDRRVGPSGYHIDCNPKGSAAHTAVDGGGADGDEREETDEAQLRRKVAFKVRKLLSLVEDETITLAQFAGLVADMEGCREAFDWPSQA